MAVLSVTFCKRRFQESGRLWDGHMAGNVETLHRIHERQGISSPDKPDPERLVSPNRPEPLLGGGACWY